MRKPRRYPPGVGAFVCATIDDMKLMVGTISEHGYVFDATIDGQFMGTIVAQSTAEVGSYPELCSRFVDMCECFSRMEYLIQVEWAKGSNDERRK